MPISQQLQIDISILISWMRLREENVMWLIVRRLGFFKSRANLPLGQ